MRRKGVPARGARASRAGRGPKGTRSLSRRRTGRGTPPGRSPTPRSTPRPTRGGRRRARRSRTPPPDVPAARRRRQEGAPPPPPDDHSERQLEGHRHQRSRPHQHADRPFANPQPVQVRGKKDEDHGVKGIEKVRRVQENVVAVVEGGGRGGHGRGDFTTCDPGLPPFAAFEENGRMSQPLRLALAQVNATVGDIAGNVRTIHAACGRAREAGAHLVVFPEMVLPGYPPEDLLLRASFVEENLAAWRGVAGRVRGGPRGAGVGGG